MREFESQLLRLKQVLRLAEDQDVAVALGMTKAAFSARKVRGVFPEDKLKALATDRPELNLDVKFVLTGHSDELERRLSALQNATNLAGRVADEHAIYDVQREVFDLLVNSLSQEEQTLIHNFRNSDQHGRSAILATAAAISLKFSAVTRLENERAKE